ncbi:MAG TPA: hypothetical protein VEO02_13165 [Thermoanaerobaculia bacterium]|nr:hypothetical protein [Thermoanaerobaculia bacterium]
MTRHGDGREKADAGQADRTESVAATFERTGWASRPARTGRESGTARRLVEEKCIDVPEHERAADEADQGKKASHHGQDWRQSGRAGESTENYARDETGEAGSRMPKGHARVGRPLSLLQALHGPRLILDP